MIALLLLASCARDPDAPPEIKYDHQVCDHCGMLISDPSYAAALVGRDGSAHAFDDPGCLLSYMMQHPASYEHLWFSAGDRWYTEAEVAFQTGQPSPMGSGLRAVPKGTPGALSVGEASNRVVGR